MAGVNELDFNVDVFPNPFISSISIEVPKAFSVRDDRELPLIQDLMARLNSDLLVAQVATGVHVNGGSTVKTLTKRLEAAAAAGEDPDKVAAEHQGLVRTIDKAAARGALHKNTAARKKARAARVAAASGT